jgi:hypothetical protein
MGWPGRQREAIDRFFFFVYSPVSGRPPICGAGALGFAPWSPAGGPSPESGASSRRRGRRSRPDRVPALARSLRTAASRACSRSTA